MPKNTYADGLQDAIVILQNTAADFDEIGERMERMGKSRLLPSDRKQIEILKEKSQLLRGQVMHIQNLAPKQRL